MKDFVDQVVNGIKSLSHATQLGVMGQSYQPANFGNAHVQFSASGFEIRFVCDRGDIFFEIAKNGAGQWWPVDMICEVLGRETPGFDLKSNLISLENMLPELTRLYGGPEYLDFEMKLEALAQQRRDTMLKRAGK